MADKHGVKDRACGHQCGMLWRAGEGRVRPEKCPHSVLAFAWASSGCAAEWVKQESMTNVAFQKLTVEEGDVRL